MKRYEIDKAYIEKALQKPARSIDDFKSIKHAVALSNAVYLGKPCGVLYMPKFYTEDDLTNFKAIVDQMMAVCKRMIELYITNGAVRKKYDFGDRLEKLILKETPYSSNVPMARFDIFYYGDNDFKFCEINTDGSSAMNEDMVLASIFSMSAMMNEMTAQYDISAFELFDTWVEELQNIYFEASGKTEKPVVAIVDFIDKSSSVEFEEFLARFKKYGYQAYIVDPRDLSYSDGLYYGDQKIDVVYRRLVTRDMMERIDEIAAFEQACLDDQTVIIGNIRSQIVHTKLFFKLLFDQDIRQYFDSEMLSFIDQHIPKTYDMTFLKQHVDYIVEMRHKYILKPIDYYGSKGVFAGSEHSADAWRDIIEDCIAKPYIIQDYCPEAITENIDLINGDLVVDGYCNITGLFIYNEKLYGVYSRAGKKAILSGIHDVYTLPTFLVK